MEVGVGDASSVRARSSSTSLNPPIYNKVRGSKRAAIETARGPARREAALAAYRRDQRSINDASCFNLATWEEFHAEWYLHSGCGEVPPSFPLTPDHIERGLGPF